MDLMSLLAKLTLDKEEYDKGLEDAEKSAEGLKITTPKLEDPAKAFTDGLAEAQDKSNVFHDVVKGVWEGLKDSIVSIGVTGVILGVTNAMKQGISLAIDGGKKIADNSKNLQLSAKAYQEYEYALGKSGLKAKDLSTAMTSLDKILSGKLNEDQQRYLENLKEVGFAASETASKEENLANMMKALADYQGTDKGLIIDWLFGKNQNWTGFFEQSSDEIDALKKQANDMGLVMSDESVENAVKFNEATEKINQQLEAIKRSFGETVLPLLTDAVSAVSSIIDFFAGNGQKSLSELIGDVDEKALVAAKDTEKAVSTTKALVEDLASLGDYWTLDEAGKVTWNTLAAEALELFPQLSEYIDTDGKKINANTQEIEANIDAWARLEKQRILSSAMEEKRTLVAQQLQTAYEKGAEARAKMDEFSPYAEEYIKIANALTEFSKTDVAPWGGNTFASAWEKRYGTSLPEMFDESNIMQFVEFARDAGDEYGRRIWQTADMESSDVRNKLNELSNESYDIRADAETLRTEADALIQEANEANEKLLEYEQYLTEEMGLVADSANTASESGKQATADAHELKHAIDELPDSKTIDISVAISEFGGRLKNLFGFAKGNWDVPYDNFPALLHRNEMVLTASQARRYRDGESGSVNYDTIAEIVAVAVGDTLNKVNVLMSGEKVGDLTTRRVKNNINSSSYSRLRAFGG